MASKSKASKNSNFDESELSKGQLRKLGALRKSLGQDIADKAFAEWLASETVKQPAFIDKDAQMIAEALQQLRDEKGLRIRRGGYVVSSGRGRTIVEPAQWE